MRTCASANVSMSVCVYVRCERLTSEQTIKRLSGMCMYCGPIPWLYLWAGSFIFVCCFVHKFLAMTQSDTFVNRCTFVCKHCCSLFFIYAFLC